MEPFVARRAKNGLLETVMHYVCLLRSISRPDQTYIGYSGDLKQRLTQHNAGMVPHTSKFMPWRLVAYLGFASKYRTLAFEKYLKTASGKAFARKRLWG